MDTHELIKNQLRPNEEIILAAKQEPKLFRFLLYMFFGQALVLGGAIGIVIMVQDSFSDFWQTLADRAAFLPYLLIAALMLVTFLVINTLAKQRFHKELRTYYVFTNESLILIHEATEEYKQAAIGRSEYKAMTSDNYKYFSSEKYIHFFDIVFDNPVFDNIKLYRFYLGDKAPQILKAMEVAQANAKDVADSEEENF